MKNILKFNSLEYKKWTLKMPRWCFETKENKKLLWDIYKKIKKMHQTEEYHKFFIKLMSFEVCKSINNLNDAREKRHIYENL